MKLPADVSEWFDLESYPQAPLTTFAQSIAPAELLDPASTAVWGGLKLPDTLPILSDGGGNVLCLRFAIDGKVSEIIHWDHEGGWWKPYGDSLAEALVLDAAFSLIDRARNEPEDLCEEETLTFAEWGARWTRDFDAPQLRSLAKDVPNLLNRLSDSGVAPVAIAQQQCRDHLTTRLNRLCRQVGARKIAELATVPWPEFRQWLHQPELVPENQKEILAAVTTIPFEELTYQDWDTAVAKAQLVLRMRQDLAWPFAVLGRYENVQHHTDKSVHYYAAGLQTVGTSEDFVLNWSNWSLGQSKFIPYALAALKPSLGSEKDAYLELFSSPSSAILVRDYWIGLGEQAERRGEYEAAYRCYYAAGWDIPIQEGIEDILERLEKAATKAGHHAQALLARHHRLSVA